MMRGGREKFLSAVLRNTWTDNSICFLWFRLFSKLKFTERLSDLRRTTVWLRPCQAVAAM